MSEADSEYKKNSTHFGFAEVKPEQKAEKVGEVFHAVAAKYDVMNDLLSFGIHRLWKRYTVELSGVRAGSKVLDVAGGTGDLSAAFSKRVGPTGRVVLTDINASMLSEGRARMINEGRVGNMSFALADAEKLPFATDTFDCITIVFGLRNVTDKPAALRSMYRVLKPGGRLLVLEFSKPKSKLLSRVYDEYSFKVMPKMGEVFAQDAESYRYLAESIRMHPDQDTLLGMMEEAGFEQAQYYNLTGGIAVVHRGFKL